MSSIVGERQALAATERAAELAQRTYFIPDTCQKGFPAAVKRSLDLVLGLMAIVAAIPVFLACSVLIAVESGWPIFFCQKRVGMGGRVFTVYKFRSMAKDAERRLHEVKDNNEVKDGPIFKWRDDPRITRAGKFLRRTSLDELPQLFNVLLGQMSLVGPRPPLEPEVLLYEDWHLQRLSVKPGMTGLWQVSGRSALGFADMMRLDIEYIRTWSVWKDLVLLARTPLAVLFARGSAY
jgi:lipopolysaccharide/colanic/teichoic acid biosynthesis glycosyltransferase